MASVYFFFAQTKLRLIFFVKSLFWSSEFEVFQRSVIFDYCFDSCLAKEDLISKYIFAFTKRCSNQTRDSQKYFRTMIQTRIQTLINLDSFQLNHLHYIMRLTYSIGQMWYNLYRSQLSFLSFCNSDESLVSKNKHDLFILEP